MMITDDYGFCDICNGMYVLGSDDHNGDTGNHFECENEPVTIVVTCGEDK